VPHSGCRFVDDVRIKTGESQCERPRVVGGSQSNKNRGEPGTSCLSIPNRNSQIHRYNRAPKRSAGRTRIRVVGSPDCCTSDDNSLLVPARPYHRAWLPSRFTKSGTDTYKRLAEVLLPRLLRLRPPPLRTGAELRATCGRDSAALTSAALSGVVLNCRLSQMPASTALQGRERPINPRHLLREGIEALLCTCQGPLQQVLILRSLCQRKLLHHTWGKSNRRVDERQRRVPLRKPRNR
jgi:hypothetical protein